MTQNNSPVEEVAGLFSECMDKAKAIADKAGLNDPAQIAEIARDLFKALTVLPDTLPPGMAAGRRWR